MNKLKYCILVFSYRLHRDQFKLSECWKRYLKCAYVFDDFNVKLVQF